MTDGETQSGWKTTQHQIGRPFAALTFESNESLSYGRQTQVPGGKIMKREWAGGILSVL